MRSERSRVWGRERRRGVGRPLAAGLALVLSAHAFARPAAAQPGRPGGQPTGIPRATWPEDYFIVFDGVTASAGLPRLRETALPVGQREVRVWIGGGMTYPQRLFRFVERDGRVEGMIVLHWEARPPDTALGERRGETFHDLMRYSQAGRCTRFRVRADTGTCLAQFRSPPDWRGTLRRMEAEGLWTLPDESTLPDKGYIVLDGTSVTVELRDSERYRAYEYGQPSNSSSQPEEAHAARIWDLLSDVTALERPSDAVKVYRGELRAAPGMREFRACGSKVSWGYEGNVPQSDVLPDSALATRQFVEVRAELTPEWLARQWESKYPRVLQVSEVLAARPWEASSCH